MRIPLLSLALASLIGCAGTADTSDDTTNIGADMPAYCAEDSRTPVTDPSVAADGFGFTAADAIAAQAGTFGGDLTRSSGTTPLVLTVSVGSVDAVTSVLVDPRGSDTGPQMGAPDGPADCPPAYELALSGTLVAADGSFDEAFEAPSRAFDAASGAFTASIDLAHVHGTARPDLNPAEWDAVTLVIDASLQDGAWVGSLMWSASNDTSGDTDTTVCDTATGVCTGTVSVSGQTEGAGSFALTHQ